jgi:hypothetical protein
MKEIMQQLHHESGQSNVISFPFERWCGGKDLSICGLCFYRYLRNDFKTIDNLYFLITFTKPF